MEMNYYTPTMNIRFVERKEESHVDVNGHILPRNIVRVVTRRVLQQEWTSPYAGDLPQWRDVPLDLEVSA